MEGVGYVIRDGGWRGETGDGARSRRAAGADEREPPPGHIPDGGECARVRLHEIRRDVRTP